MTGLLNCPFCGADQTRLIVMGPTCKKDSPYDPADRAFPVVRCRGCHVEVPGKDWDFSRKSAIEAWNRRVDPEPQAEPDPCAHAWEPSPYCLHSEFCGKCSARRSWSQPRTVIFKMGPLP